MLRALAAILVTTSFVSTASAQYYIEENARDAVCEWQYKGKKGIDICHIIAMGSHSMSDVVLVFTMGNKTFSLISNDEYHYQTAEIGTGKTLGSFKARWKGTYRDKFEWVGEPETSGVSVNTIKISNGYKIKIVY